MKKLYKKHSSVFVVISILVIIFLLHLSYIPNGFSWLDRGDILEGRTIIPIPEISNMFVLRFGDTAFYRPLVTLLNSTDFALYKGFAPGYHFTNLLLHLAVAAAVPFFLSVFFTFSFPEMMFAMLLVGIHPLSWLPVGAISYRPELLFTLFSLLTVYFHAKARLTEKEFFRFASVGCLYLALISKETAVVIIPAMILFWEFLRKKTTVKHSSKQQWKWSLYISELIVFIIYIVYRFRAVPEIWKATNLSLSFSDAIGTRLSVLLKLISDFFVPLKPPLSDGVPVDGIFTIFPIIMFFILAVLAISIVKAGVRSSWSKAIILFLILLTPALNIVPVPRIGSPHYGYLPLAAFSALVIILFQFISKISASVNKVSLIIIGCWLFIMSVTVFAGGFRFQNDRTLFQPEIISDPHFLEGYFYLGNYYLRQNNLNLSENYYMHALQSDPKILAYTEKQSIYINLASIYLQKNQLTKADNALSQAESLTKHQNIQALFHNRILLAYKKHDYKNVINLSQNDGSFPYTPNIYIVLADSLHQLGRNDEAVAALRQVLPLVNKQERQKVQSLIQTMTHKK